MDGRMQRGFHHGPIVHVLLMARDVKGQMPRDLDRLRAPPPPRVAGGYLGAVVAPSANGMPTLFWYIADV